MTTKPVRLELPAILVSTLIAWSAAAQTVPAAPASDIGQMEEIVVTAQKRSENSQDVPVSLAVFSPQQLDQLGINDVEQMSKIVPGLVVMNSSGGLQAYIRGIGDSPSNITQEGGVGIYVDGVYQAPFYSTNQQFADVERVEVLKGPQGTLYGRNTTGGAINIITREPSIEPTGYFETSYGNYGTTQLKAYLSGGNEFVQGSISTVFNRHDGYVTDLTNGNDNLDNLNVSTTRGKLKFVFNDKWSATLIGTVTQNNDTGDQTYVHLTDSTPAGNVVANPHEVYLNDDGVGRKDINDWSVASKIDGDLGFMNVVSITSYDRTTIGSGVDTDITDVPLQHAIFHQFGSNFSQEIQLLSPNDSKLTWIVGGFYFWSFGGFDHFDLFSRSDVTSPLLDIQILGQQMTRAIAGFGQATYQLTDAWNVTLGARYNSETAELRQRDESIVGLGTLENDPVQSTTWNNFSPKLSIEYKFGSHLFYGTVTRGFKSGLYNILAPGTPAVDPETITAFEVGNKNTFGWLTLNPAVFLYDYKNLQVDVIDPSSNFSSLQNAASTRNYGFDLDSSATANSQLSFNFGLEYLHARFRQYDNAEIYVPSPAGGNISERAPSLAGYTPTYAPAFTFNSAVNYRIADLTLTGSWQHNSGYYVDTADRVRQPAFDLLGARAELALPQQIHVFAYINNALNKNVITFSYITNFGDGALYSDPRIYGAGVSYRF